MLNDPEKANLQIIHDSIVRTMNMISDDFKQKGSNMRFMQDVIDYVLWFEEKYKYKFRNCNNHLIVKKGEIYNCNFGRNIGSEQDKLRPAIILQNDIGNVHSPTTVVAPITDEMKAKLPTHIDIKELNPKCAVHGEVLIEQLRCISKSRLANRLDIVNTESEGWNKVIKALKIELDVSYNLKKH